MNKATPSVWQQFTKRLQEAVSYSQEEAGRRGSNTVSAEHLLLGMLRDRDNTACRILILLGVSPTTIHRQLVRQIPAGEGPREIDMQLEPRGKHVLDLARDEAKRLGNLYIGTQHLLLGFLRLEEGLAFDMLAKFGVTLERVREEVPKLQDTKSEIPSEEAIQKTVAEQTQALKHAAQNVGSADQLVEINALREAIAADAAGWCKKSVLSLFDISAAQIRAVLDVAAGLKKYDLARQTSLYWAYPRTLALLFEKPSLRTRVSFEVSMAHLQGQAIYLAPGDVGLGTREAIPDVAEALARWVDILAARVFQHETIEELAANSSIPVINALSDREHPIQAFADLLTLEEQKGTLGNNIKLAYVGDGNNVLHALLLACAKMGVHCTAACPKGYAPDARYVAEAQGIGEETGARIELLTDPIAAVADADAVYTDVWASMGQESEKESRSQIFAPYQINEALMRHAKSDAIVLHCLPAHRGEEVSADIMAQHKTVVFDQAENRLHTQKALLVLILGL